MTRTLTIQLPDDLMTRLAERARIRQRSIEDETAELVAASFADDEIPSDVMTTVKNLQHFDDDALMRVAKMPFTPEASERLEELHLRQQDQGVTPAEREEIDRLTQQYDRNMLLRAEATAVLMARGIQVKLDPLP